MRNQHRRQKRNFCWQKKKERQQHISHARNIEFRNEKRCWRRHRTVVYELPKWKFLLPDGTTPAMSLYDDADDNGGGPQKTNERNESTRQTVFGNLSRRRRRSKDKKLNE
jgi:hypothetical protein